MGDPVSAGVVGSVIAPELGAAVAAPTISSALATGLSAGAGYGAGGESLFGFEPSISGVGQGVMESLGGVNKFINAYPTTSQIGFGLAKQAFQPNQPMHMAPAGQVKHGQIQPMDYMSLLNPQSQSVMRPQPISLL